MRARPRVRVEGESVGNNMSHLLRCKVTCGEGDHQPIAADPFCPLGVLRGRLV